MSKDRHDKTRFQSHKQQDNAVDYVNGKRKGAHRDAASARGASRLTGGTVCQGKAATVSNSDITPTGTAADRS